MLFRSAAPSPARRMRGALPWLVGAAATLALGAWLWRAFGLGVWLDQALAFCL